MTFQIIPNAARSLDCVSRSACANVFLPELFTPQRNKAEGENSVESESGSAAPENLPEGWKKLRTTDGKKYYANRESGESSWSKPSEDPVSKQV